MTHYQRLGWQAWLDPTTDLSKEEQEVPDWDLRIAENERFKAELEAEREGGKVVLVKRGQSVDVAKLLQERSDEQRLKTELERGARS